MEKHLARFGSRRKPTALTLLCPLILALCTTAAATEEPTHSPALARATTTEPNRKTGTVAVREMPACPKGDEWHVENEACRLVLHLGTELTIAPGSHVKLLPMVPGTLGGKHGAKSNYSVQLVSGQIDVDIDPTRHPIYGVILRAPSKIGAIVKSGTATVVASTNGVLVAARTSRDTLVSLDEHWRPLKPGMLYSVARSHPLGITRPIPLPPELQIDSPISFGFGDGTASCQIRVKMVGDSAKYRLGVYHATTGRLAHSQEGSATDAVASLPTLAPGRYELRASSIDVDGLVSSPSKPQSFRVIGAILPPSALVTGSAIRMPVGARLGLLETEGIEVGYGTHSTPFVAAPPTIALDNDRPVVLRIREIDSKREAQLHLQPINITPRISLGPMRATWPGAPLRLEVFLPHGDGQQAALAQGTTLSVTVNNHPVKVAVERRDGRLFSLVEKPPLAGPWVVRVMVLDAAGRELGRDFLEVAVKSEPDEVREIATNAPR